MKKSRFTDEQIVFALTQALKVDVQHVIADWRTLRSPVSYDAEHCQQFGGVLPEAKLSKFAAEHFAVD